MDVEERYSYWIDLAEYDKRTEYPLNIEARYPRAKEEILKKLNLQKCKSLLKQTEELLEWIKNKS